MNLSQQLQNNEVRAVTSTIGAIKAQMPGSVVPAIGEQHTIGRVPKGSIVTGWTIIGKGFSSDVVVSVGFPDNPTFWLDNVTLVSTYTQTNDPLQPMQDLFKDGADIIITIHSGGFDGESEIRFVLNCVEYETKLGKYAA